MLQGKMKGIMILGAAAIVVLLSSCGSSSANPASTTSPSANQKITSTKTSIASADERLSISLDKTQVNPGETFIVNVMVDSKQVTRGAECALSFDPAAMQCTGIKEGNFFKDWANANSANTTQVPSDPQIDNAKGTVEATGIALMGGMKGATVGPQGSGILFSYTMVAKNGINKKVSFTLSQPSIVDANADDLPVSVANGEITIGTP
jgi:hypothetical protein